MSFLPQIAFRRWGLGFALLLWLTQPVQVLAQSVSDYQVKAAYFYTFAKFVEWPSQAFRNSGEAVRLCILNDRSFEVALARAVKGKSVAGRPIEVIQVQDGTQARNCHALFINSVQARYTRHIVEALRGTSVLTVGEGDAFIQEGGVITFVLEDDRVQFQVNKRAAVAADLYISSRLLSVASRTLE